MEKVTFNSDWYKALISKSDEKQVLVASIKDIISDGKFRSCLEIGLGTSTFFSENLSPEFNTYTIVEREAVDVVLPANTELIHADWESAVLQNKYDVILALHVVYYFNDKKAAIQKMFDCLNPGGVVIFVVNGKDGDYGPLKQKFSELIHEEYKFAYDELKALLSSKDCKEVSIPSTIIFRDADELFQSLFLSFDAYPSLYVQHKDEIVQYFDKTLINNKFIINQKIFIGRNNPWEKLIDHEDYEIEMGGANILIKDKVFTPDKNITYSTTFLLESIPKDIAGKMVLDMGCGTGIIGISCALRGAASVVCSDISDRAIENTKINIAKNNVANVLEVVQSDVFANITDTFDYIFANLPILDEVWLSVGVEKIISSFIENCKQHTKPGGKVFLVWASFSTLPIERLSELCEAQHYQYSIKESEVSGFVWYLVELSF